MYSLGRERRVSLQPSSLLSEVSPGFLLMSIFPLMVSCRQSSLWLSHIFPLFQTLPITQFQTHFHILRYLLQQSPLFPIAYSVLVSQGRHNKVLLTKWLKKQVFQARSLKSRCCQGESVPDLSPRVFSAGTLQHSLACRYIILIDLYLHLHMASFCVSSHNLPSAYIFL